MRKQTVPHALVVALFFVSSIAFATGEVADLPNAADAPAPAPAPTAGTTYNGDTAQQGVQNPADPSKWQAAVERAANFCENVSREALEKCNDDDIKPAKVSGSGLGSADQLASLKQMTAAADENIKKCSPYHQRCQAQCTRSSDQMEEQCPKCNFTSMRSASNECTQAGDTLARLRRQKAQFIAATEKTKQHAQNTSDAPSDPARGGSPSRPGDVADNGGGGRNSSTAEQADRPMPAPAPPSSGASNGGGSSSGRDNPTPAPKPDDRKGDSRVSDNKRSPMDSATRETGRVADATPTHTATDKNGNGIPDKNEKLDADKGMKTSSVSGANGGATAAATDPTKTPTQDATPSSSSADDKAERKAAKRAARQQNEMQQQMQTSMMQQSLQQMGQRVQQQQTQLAQQKQALSAQQSQAVIAATIAQQNAMAATLAAQQAARAPASAGQATFAMAGSLLKKTATPLNPNTQVVVNAVSERPLAAGQTVTTAGVRGDSSASWNPNGNPVALAASQNYDPNAHTNASELNQRRLGVEDGGGAGGGGGGKPGARKVKVDGQPMTVAELTGDSHGRTVAGMGDAEQGIQSSAVDIWGLVSQRFQAACSAGRLKDCH